MEEDRSLAAEPTVATAACVFLVAAGAAGCGLLDLTDDGDDAAPSRRPLRLESLQPSADTLSPTPTIRIGLSDYPDTSTFDSGAVAILRAGGLTWAGTADYRMVDRELVWSASRPLPTGVRVELILNDEISAVTGAPFDVTTPAQRWTIAADGASAEVDPRSDITWADVAPVFDARCNGCHGDPERDLPPMTREALLSRRSEQVDRPLVRPFDAAGSYLMHKLLSDYPDRRYQRQPPPWSENGTELPEEQLRRIEAWIDAGAPR